MADLRLEHHLLTIGVELSAKVGANLIVGANKGLVAAAGDRALGVAVMGGASGETALVATDGIAPVEASAAIAQYALVQSETTGKAKTRAASKHVVGVALDAAAAAGDVIPVLLRVATTA